MVNILSLYMSSVLYKVMKLAKMQPKDVEIEPGTVMRFWVPTKDQKKKPPLLLLHGFAGTGILTFQCQVLSSLRKKYSIYVPDLIFFGGSYTDKPDRTARFQADCVAQAMKKLGVEEKCTVVGFSYGGFIGFQMAEHHPEVVGSMVVTGANVALSESLTKIGLKKIGFSCWSDFLMPDTVEGVKVLLDIGSYGLPWLPRFFYKHYLKIMFDNRKEKIELLEALVVKDEDVSQHQFQQRIHILWGKEEEIFDVDVANSLKERLGDKTKLQFIKKAGHLCLLERPFVFNKYLKQMLDSLANESNHPASLAV